LLGKSAPDPFMMGLSLIMVLVVLIGGIVYFRQMEREFADII